MANRVPESCPLCSGGMIEFEFHQILHHRDFYLCKSCDLSFVDRKQLLSEDDEKSRYDFHQNDIRTVGYEKFLRRLINPIKEKFAFDAKGLDFGSGPYPMLIEIMNEEGFDNIISYDAIYDPNISVFDNTYDFITACEVLEHVYKLEFELKRIIKSLNIGADLVVSTGVKQPGADITKWHYIHDDTHINLFSLKTFEFMAQKYQLKISKLEKALVIFSKR